MSGGGGGGRGVVLEPALILPRVLTLILETSKCQTLSCSLLLNIKPIFHCDANYLASGVGVGQCPRRQNFVLGIPTCWYLGANANPYICVTPDAKPRPQSVEYRWRWVPNAQFLRWPCTFHVFCVDFIRIGHPTQTPFPVKYGLKGCSQLS